jgi:hypothetical protein
MKIFTGFLLMLPFMPISAYATDQSGNYAIWGMGNKSCFSYTNARKSDEYDNFKYYIMGYLTAFNALTPETFRVSGNMNLKAILAWFDDYCELKAVYGFDQAVSDFIVEHYDDRVKTSSASPGGRR